MATRTALGIVKAKASGTNLTISSVSLSEGDCLLVAVGFQGVNPPATVKKGAFEMHKLVQRIDDTGTFGCAIYFKRRINNDQTIDIKADWAASIGARVMAAIKLDRAHVIFETAGNKQTASTAPTTGEALNDLPVHNCFHWGILVSQGPSSDVAPSLPGDWYTGQRDGLVGAPPVSNITLLEGFKTGRCIDPEELDGTGATERDWCNCLATIKPITNFPAIDGNGIEIMVDDTVDYNGTEYTVTAIYNELSLPVALVELGSSFYVFSYNTELVE